MFFSFAKIFAWLLKYKYLMLFPVAVVEGPIITVIAGFLASMGQLNFFLAYGVVVAGDIVGDALYYFLGNKGGKNLLSRYGNYLKLPPERLKVVENFFQKNFKKTILIAKFSQAFSLPVLLTAGIIRADFFKFMWVNALGTLVKSMIFLTIGYYFGRSYVQINRYINNTVWTMTIAAGLLIIFYLIINKITKKYFNK